LPVSRSGHVDVVCTECHVPQQAEVWTIVDIWERPDLATRLQQGLLHIIPCSKCGARMSVDTPLLVYRSYKEDEPILLSMPPDTFEEDARDYGVSLLAQLRDALQGEWQPRWLAEKHPTVDRVEVRVTLNIDLVLIGRQMMMAEDAELALDAGQVPDVLAALWELLSSESWVAAMPVLSRHPALCDKETISLLDEFVRAVQLEQDKELVDTFTEHRAFLVRCHQVGAQAAVAEMEASDALA